jgi:hypothetical protein
LSFFKTVYYVVNNNNNNNDDDDDDDDDNNNNNKIKFKQLDHWQYQYLDTVLELLIGTKKNCKS